MRGLAFKQLIVVSAAFLTSNPRTITATVGCKRVLKVSITAALKRPRRPETTTGGEGRLRSGSMEARRNATLTINTTSIISTYENPKDNSK